MNSLSHRFKKWFPLTVLSLALCIIIIDTTLLNVSITVLEKELHTTLEGIQWVIAAYTLTLASLLITGGRLGDIFGRKKMFILGACVFALGSLLASLSNNLSTMIIGESIIEGIGAAMMMPATTSLILSNYHGHDRAIAFGMWGGIAAAAGAIGPILGGFLTTFYSWRWGFRINIVVALFLVIGSRWIKEASAPVKQRKLDVLGVFLSALGMFTLVFSIIKASDYGWIFAKKSIPYWQNIAGPISIIPLTLTLGISIILLFIWVQWNREHVQKKVPLISLKMFTIPSFSLGLLVTLLMGLVQAIVIFAIPVFLQSVCKLNAMATGLALLPLPLAIFFMSSLSGFLTTRYRPKTIVSTGLALCAAGLFLLGFSFTATALPHDFWVALSVYGVGAGMVMAQINTILLSAVPASVSGEASGINSTTRQVGSSFGFAIVGSIILTVFSYSFTKDIENNTSIPSYFVSSILNPSQKQLTLESLEQTLQEEDKNIPPAVLETITRIKNTATATANTYAMWIAWCFAVCTFVVIVRFLPNTPTYTRKP